MGAAYSKVPLFGHLEVTCPEGASQSRRMLVSVPKARKDHSDPQGTKQTWVWVILQ